MKLTPTKKRQERATPYVVVSPKDAALWAKCSKGTQRGETWAGVLLRFNAATRKRQAAEIRWWKSSDKPAENGGGLIEVVILANLPTRRKVVVV